MYHLRPCLLQTLLWPHPWDAAIQALSLGFVAPLYKFLREGMAAAVKHRLGLNFSLTLELGTCVQRTSCTAVSNSPLLEPLI